MINRNSIGIAIFCYNREKHIKIVLEKIFSITESSEFEIYIFSDGSKNLTDIDNVTKVRSHLLQYTNKENLTVIKRDKNFGLSKNIILGVSFVLKKHEAIIVLEDDVVPNENFLKFMHEMLNNYKENMEVFHISAWSVGLDTPNTEIFFADRMLCSGGWGTWSNRWVYFNRDVNIYKKVSPTLLKNFDKSPSLGYIEQLKDNYLGWNSAELRNV